MTAPAFAFLPNALEGIGCNCGETLERCSGEGDAGADVEGNREVSAEGRIDEFCSPSRSTMRIGGSFDGAEPKLFAVSEGAVEGMLAGAAAVLTAVKGEAFEATPGFDESPALAGIAGVDAAE